jgi:hypothetical protein
MMDACIIKNSVEMLSDGNSSGDDYASMNIRSNARGGGDSDGEYCTSNARGGDGNDLNAFLCLDEL